MADALPMFPDSALLFGRSYFSLQQDPRLCKPRNVHFEEMDGEPVDLGMPGDWFAALCPWVWTKDAEKTAPPPSWMIFDGVSGCSVGCFSKRATRNSALACALKTIKRNGIACVYQSMIACIELYGPSPRWKDGGELEAFARSLIVQCPTRGSESANV